MWGDAAGRKFVDNTGCWLCLSMDSKLEIIGKGAFGSCGLTSVTFPSSLTTIGGYSFGFCRGLASVTIPNSVTTIGDAAFCLCDCLQSIFVPNSVTSIGFGAFTSCNNMEFAVIGSGVTSIGEQAFHGNLRLKNVILYSPSCTLGTEVFDFCDSLTHIYVLSDKVEAYKNAENWSNYADLITPLTGTGIGAIASSQEPTTDGQYYDLSGRRVANGIEPRAKGLYIVDGKKVVIK